MGLGRSATPGEGPQRPQLNKFDTGEALHANGNGALSSYLDAVVADGYRITVINLPQAPDGKAKSFIFGRAAGRELHTSGQVLAAQQELARLDSRGENIYLTPVSSFVHHMLVDDLDIVKLGRLVSSGFKPCVVLQSSQGSLQCLLNVPKLGTELDREAANALMVRLNKTLGFGDPKIAGSVHPHRMPDTHNWKPSRRLEDGSRPVVQLLKFEARQCERSGELLAQIASEMEAGRAAKRVRQPAASVAASAAGRGGDDGKPGDLEGLEGAEEVAEEGAAQRAAASYCAHRLDILSRHVGDVDESRTDFMVCVRLRATGHPRAAIRDALISAALAARSAQSTHSNWLAYCQRTANSAWGPSGDADIQKLAARWLASWQRLEAQGVKRGGLS